MNTPSPLPASVRTSENGNLTFIKYTNPPNLTKLLSFIVMLAIGWGGVKLASHAVARHGSEAEAIRKCLEDNNGPMHVFKNQWNEFFLLCQLNDGRWGWQIVTEQGYEKTAYVAKTSKASPVYPSNLCKSVSHKNPLNSRNSWQKNSHLHRSNKKSVFICVNLCPINSPNS